jgi:hyperosmotically inducible protein
MRTLADRVVIAASALLMAAASVSGGQAMRPSPSRSADEWVTTQIQAQYFLDPAIKARAITVLTLNGIVTLEGDVNTPEESTRAVEIARGVNGVKDVVNSLTVAGEPQPAATSGTLGVTLPTDQARVEPQAPEAPASDEAILAEIRTRVAADPALSMLDLDVRVEHGVVRLAGDVPDLSARIRAERLARASRGVIEVRNDLSVKR